MTITLFRFFDAIGGEEAFGGLATGACCCCGGAGPGFFFICIMLTLGSSGFAVSFGFVVGVDGFFFT